jgi:hypothetical protein
MSSQHSVVIRWLPFNSCPNVSMFSRINRNNQSRPITDRATISLRCRYISWLLDVLCVLLCTAGIAAFVSSATSPDDDDFQQEFIQQKSSHYQRIKQSGKVRVGYLPSNRNIASAFLLTPSPSLDEQREFWIATKASTRVAIAARTSGQRSPPAL